MHSKDTIERRKRAAQLARSQSWEKAAHVLANPDPGPDPLVASDLATCLYMSGKTDGAVEVLTTLPDDAPLIARLNKLYITKAFETLGEFDPAWQHIDHDGSACPERPPLVSVIVRTFNRPEFLKEALASLAAQTFQDFEVLVINDGGDPAAQDVVKACGISKARYAMMEKRGPVFGLNAGLEMAHGKYVTGLDDDDVAYPDHLEKLAKYLESPDSAPVAYADHKLVQYAKAPDNSMAPSSSREVRTGEFSRSRLLKTNVVPSVMLMARRSCFEEAGRFCTALPKAMDWEMWLRLSERFEFHHLPFVTAEVRERPGDHNLSLRKKREKYFWDNLVLYMHKGLPILSEPKNPHVSAGYARAIELLGHLGEESPEIERLVNLRGFWDMEKPYRWFADHGRWMEELGEPELAKRFYRVAMKLDPLQPKLWGKLLKSGGGK